MTCRELADFLMDYLNGELPGEVRAAFERHLALCPNCVAYVKTYQATVALERKAFAGTNLQPDDVPEDLVRAILDARKGDPQ